MFPPGFTCPAVLWIRSARFRFRLRASHPLWRTFPRPSANFHSRMTVRTPKIRRPSVWPPPRSLATTCGISVDVFSCPYLDVSVQGVPRVLSRPSSAPDAKAFPLRSYQLDHFWFSIMNYAGHRRISFYRSNCSCYPIIPQYLFQTAFAVLPSVALLLLFFSLFSFQGAVPVKDRIKTLKGSLSVLIHSSMVEISGIEPLTSCVQSRRSPG